MFLIPTTPYFKKEFKNKIEKKNAFSLKQYVGRRLNMRSNNEEMVK